MKEKQARQDYSLSDRSAKSSKVDSKFTGKKKEGEGRGGKNVVGQKKGRRRETTEGRGQSITHGQLLARC